MAAKMSEQKRLGIACGTPIVMLLMAIIASKVGGTTVPPAAATVAAAHESFQAEVETPLVTETIVAAQTSDEPQAVTALKPDVENNVADQPPEIASLVESTDTASETPNAVDESFAETNAASDESPELFAESVTVEASPDPEPSPGPPPSPIVPESPAAATQASTEEATIPVETATDSELIDPIAAVEAPTVVEVASVAEVEDAPVLEEVTIDEKEVPVPTETPNVATLADLETPLVQLEVEESPVADSETTEIVDVQEEISEVPLVLPDVEEGPDAEIAANTVAEEPAPAEAKSAESSTAPNEPVDATPAAKPTFGKPFLGVGIRNPADNIVTTVYAGSTAGKLGMRLGDALVAVNEKPIKDMASLRSVLSGLAVSDTITLEVIRDGKRLSLGSLPLGSR